MPFASLIGTVRIDVGRRAVDSKDKICPGGCQVLLPAFFLQGQWSAKCLVL